jgi:corrinoid protein of di/trimethylamine methyltransferase
VVDLNKLYTAIVTGSLEQAVSFTRAAIEEGIDPQDIITNYLTKAMEEVGAQFESGKAFVPNLLMSGRAMKGSLEILKPLLKTNCSTTYGKVVIGTVLGDMHDIGKNLVASMLEGCGFEVINLGVDVSSERFVSALKEHNPDILCMSALLTTTMGYMKVVIESIADARLREDVKIMVGGAPLTDVFAKQIGADGYSANANSAVTLARELMYI